MLSYEELYEKYATDVLRVSYFYLGDRQRAEDVCQDVFVRLMTNAPDVVDQKQLDDLAIAVTRVEETPAEEE